MKEKQNNKEETLFPIMINYVFNELTIPGLLLGTFLSRVFHFLLHEDKPDIVCHTDKSHNMIYERKRKQ